MKQLWRRVRKAFHQFMAYQRGEKFLDLVEEIERLKRERAEAVAKEREACGKLAENYPSVTSSIGNLIAEAIRKRNTP